MLQDMLAEHYPKDIILKDGPMVTVRLLNPDDKELLLEFFRAIPPEDRLFLRDNVADEAVIEGWCRNIDLDTVLPLVAEGNGRIVASTTLHRERRGWMSHIGKVRVVIHPEYRRRGLASTMLKELLEIALYTGLEQLNAECMDTQKGAIWLFQNAGFLQRAVLSGQVRDLHGDPHDLIILAYDLRDQEFHGLD